MGVALFGALAEVFTTNLFVYSLLGVLAGMIIGVLPGLSATMGAAILTPLTFWLQPPGTSSAVRCLQLCNLGRWCVGHLD